MFRSILVDLKAHMWVFTDLSSEKSQETMARAHVVLLCYDITNADSFAAAITKWSTRIGTSNPHASVILVGTKADEAAKRVVSTTVASEFAKCEKRQMVELAALEDERGPGYARLRQLVYDRYVPINARFCIF